MSNNILYWLFRIFETVGFVIGFVLVADVNYKLAIGVSLMILTSLFTWARVSSESRNL